MDCSVCECPHALIWRDNPMWVPSGLPPIFGLPENDPPVDGVGCATWGFVEQ